MKTIRDLGSGGYGTVKLLQDETTKEVFAAKYGKLSNHFARSTYNELQILAYLRQIKPSPAVELIRHYEEDDFIVLLLKKYPHDFRGLQRLKVFDQVYINQIVFVFGSLAQAVRGMHVCNVVHRDLKSANVLLDELGHSHLADFGLACFNCQQHFDYNPLRIKDKSPIVTKTLATLIYRAPEQLFAYDSAGKQLVKIYCNESLFDLYAVGLIFFEILYCSFFFQIQTGLSEIQQQEAVKYAHVMLYRKQLVKMCTETYKMSTGEAEDYLVKHFGAEKQEKVKQLLQKEPVSTSALCLAVILMRFKEEVFLPQIYKNADQFIQLFSSLISCIPGQRKNPYNCQLFKTETQNIVSSLPEEALDKLTEIDKSKQSKILQNLEGYKFAISDNFVFGCQICCADLIKCGIADRIGSLKEFSKFSDVDQRFKQISQIRSTQQKK